MNIWQRLADRAHSLTPPPDGVQPRPAPRFEGNWAWGVGSREFGVEDNAAAARSPVVVTNDELPGVMETPRVSETLGVFVPYSRFPRRADASGAIHSNSENLRSISSISGPFPIPLSVYSMETPGVSEPPGVFIDKWPIVARRGESGVGSRELEAANTPMAHSPTIPAAAVRPKPAAQGVAAQPPQGFPQPLRSPLPIPDSPDAPDTPGAIHSNSENLRSISGISGPFPIPLSPPPTSPSVYSVVPDARLAAPASKPPVIGRPAPPPPTPETVAPPPPPPRVEIHIGRIEVRAAPPPPPPTAPARPAYKPTLSLDDYLKQRQRGDR